MALASRIDPQPSPSIGGDSVVVIFFFVAHDVDLSFVMYVTHALCQF